MKRWIAVLSAVLIITLGCTKEETQQEEDIISEDKETPKEESAEAELPYQYPLTGFGTETEPNGRAIAVMINNHPQARPQSGLHQADIVYELLAEGEVTRFLAIFQSEKPEHIGPVRSARDYYIELAKGYDSIYVTHGNSPDAKELMDKGYVDSINGLYYDGTLFKRVNFRKAPHNSYTSFEDIMKGATEKNFEMEEPPPELSFLNSEEVKQLQGEDGLSAEISYFSSPVFNSLFKYDKELGKYTRFSNGEQTVDYYSKTQILIDNVFIIETPHEIIDDVGRRQIDLISGGNGYLLQKGKLTEVKWENKDGVIVPVADGKVTGFIPGKTWINIIPANPGLQEAVSLNSLK